MREIENLAIRFSALHHVPIGMFLLRKDNTIVFWNRCLEDWTRIKAEDIVGKNLKDVYPHLTQPSYKSRLEIVFNGGQPAIFSSQLHGSILPSPLPDGKFRIQHTTVMGAPSEDDDSYYALFSIEDVTELTRKIATIREAEKTNKEKEKLSIAKEVAAAVCHELNQPLMVISGYTDLLLYDLAEGHPLNQTLEVIQKQVKITGKITRKLMNITRYATREYVAGKMIIDLDKSSST